MPRIARNTQKGRFFHVLLEGIYKENIFEEKTFKELYLNKMLRYKRACAVKVLAYIVMDNHAHALLAVDNISQLANYFKRVNSDYARCYNRKKYRDGYVFKGRFKSQVVEAGALGDVAAEIHKNCLAAGIAESADEYLYSSYNSLLNGGDNLWEVGEIFQPSYGFRIEIPTEDFGNLLDARLAVRLLGGAENIKNAVWEQHDVRLIEHDQRRYEDKRAVLKEMFKKYNIINNYSIRNVNTCRALALEMVERTGASLREIADMIDIGRETLRKWILHEQKVYVLDRDLQKNI